jgi:hypothetical protein
MLPPCVPRHHRRVKLQQSGLARQPAAVADQRAVRADDAVAGHDDGERVAAIGQPGGTAGR